MRIVVKIGQANREWQSLDDVQESWITQHIIERQRSGQPVCVYASIETSDIDVGMIAGQCPQYSSRPGPPLSQESLKVLELWREIVGRNGHVHPGDVIAFFKRVRRLV